MAHGIRLGTLPCRTSTLEVRLATCIRSARCIASLLCQIQACNEFRALACAGSSPQPHRRRERAAAKAQLKRKKLQLLKHLGLKGDGGVRNSSYLDRHTEQHGDKQSSSNASPILANLPALRTESLRSNSPPHDPTLWPIHGALFKAPRYLEGANGISSRASEPASTDLSVLLEKASLNLVATVMSTNSKEN